MKNTVEFHYASFLQVLHLKVDQTKTPDTAIQAFPFEFGKIELLLS